MFRAERRLRQTECADMLQFVIGYLRDHDKAVFAAALAIVFLLQLLLSVRYRKANASLRRRLRRIEVTLNRQEGEQSARFLRATTKRSFETDVPYQEAEKAIPSQAKTGTLTAEELL